MKAHWKVGSTTQLNFRFDTVAQFTPAETAACAQRIGKLRGLQGRYQHVGQVEKISCSGGGGLAKCYRPAQPQYEKVKAEKQL